MTAVKMRSAAEIVAERESLLRAADELLMRRAAGEELSIAEESIFWSLGWSQEFVNSETRRCGTVLRHHATAGTAQSRGKLAANAERAEADVAEQGPILRETIEQAQRKLSELEHAANLANRRHDEAVGALQSLRSVDLLPVEMRDQFNRVKVAIKERYRDVVSTEARISSIESILSLHAKGGPAWTEHLNCAGGARVTGERVIEAAYVADLRRELDELRPVLAKRSAERDEAEETLRPILEFYVR